AKTARRTRSRRPTATARAKGRSRTNCGGKAKTPRATIFKGRRARRAEAVDNYRHVFLGVKAKRGGEILGQAFAHLFAATPAGHGDTGLLQTGCSRQNHGAEVHAMLSHW